MRGKWAKQLQTLRRPVAIAALALACTAGTGTGLAQTQGASGPVSWEIADMRQRLAPDVREIRWYYTLVLRETAGKGIEFERATRGSRGERVDGSVTEAPFRRRLGPRAEIRLHYRDGIYFREPGSPGFGATPGGRSGMTVMRQFHGKDDDGNRVTVTVHIALDPSVGRKAAQPISSGALPPAKSMESGELKALAGKWQGYYRDPEGFEIPLDVTIRDDGSFEAAEDEPVTNRFRGTLRVREGNLAYATGNDQGTLTLHEGQGRRVLEGDASGKRERRAGQQVTSYTYHYALRLEAAMPTPEASRVAAPVTPPAAPSPAPEPLRPAPADVARGAALEREARQFLKDGRYSEGVTRAREAVAIREEMLGPRHVDVAESLTTLGELYRLQGRYADAERLHRRALEIREALLTRDHPLVAESLNSLAMLHQAQATYTEAEAMLQRALAILESVKSTLLRNYALQAEVLENLAKVYRALGKTTEAEEAQAKAAILSTLR